MGELYEMQTILPSDSDHCDDINGYVHSIIRLKKEKIEEEKVNENKEKKGQTW